MRRVFVLALLALALPIAAWGNGIDLTNKFGSITISAAGISSHGSQLRSFNGITAAPGHSLGSVSFSTGVCLSGCNGSGIPGDSATFSSVGSSFVVTGCCNPAIHHGVIFSGSFVGPITWTLTSPPGAKMAPAPMLPDGGNGVTVSFDAVELDAVAMYEPLGSCPPPIVR